ncbi:hypothetical protein R1sor_013156 [Riccia sorocarpa]|uniref:DDE Tnp4 domain-containing protein n=1 Tax=Riccia sorocarpa TaxID=122646 RepID=A0ABD3H8M6_9MARC
MSSLLSHCALRSLDRETRLQVMRQLVALMLTLTQLLLGELKSCWEELCEAIVDSQGCILDMFVGTPGIANDQPVLRNSVFFRRVQRGEVLQIPEKELATGFRLKPYIVGDVGYTNNQWLMSPYRPHPGAPAHIRVYNDAVVHGHLVVEQVFGRLKDRWRLLDLGIGSGIDWAPQVVHAACILHNFLLRNGD